MKLKKIPIPVYMLAVSALGGFLHSLPSPEGGSKSWEEKPAAAILLPGEAWSCTLSTAFLR